MFALARKTVFGLLATSLVIGTAQMASAKPWPKPQPWPHFYHGPAVIINPVTVVAPVTPVPAAIQLINPATNQSRCRMRSTAVRCSLCQPATVSPCTRSRLSPSTGAGRRVGAVAA